MLSFVGNAKLELSNKHSLKDGVSGGISHKYLIKIDYLQRGLVIDSKTRFYLQRTCTPSIRFPPMPLQPRPLILDLVALALFLESASFLCEDRQFTKNAKNSS